MSRYSRALFAVALCFVIPLSWACGGDAYGDPIKVYKSDGSIQCEDKGIGLEVMAKELTEAGAEVICAQKGHDGFLRIAVCGHSTGNINIYVIDQDDLQKAKDLGFSPVRELTDYQDKECK